jgi:hypothetical protein
MRSALDDFLGQLVVMAVNFVGLSFGSQKGIDARHDFDGINGLYEEVGSAAVEPPLAILGLLVGPSEENDRKPASACIGLHAPADLEAIHVRQIGVDQGHIVRPPGGLAQCLVWTCNSNDLVAALRAHGGSHRRLLFAVLGDEQNASHR